MDKSMYPPTRQLLLDEDDVNVTQKTQIADDLFETGEDVRKAH